MFPFLASKGWSGCNRAVVFIVLSTLVACDSKHGSAIDDAGRALTEAIDRTSNRVLGSIPGPSRITTAAADEVSKLFTFEYRVFDIERGTSSHNLQAILNQVGQDRWDCFHVDENENGYKLFCKRRPESYLRYVPRWLPD